MAGNNFEAEAAEVVITTPAWETARMVRPLAPEASATLNNIRYAPVAVLHLGFNRSAVSHPLDGFGYLNVPSEKPDILGCVWSSSLFTGRAPVGHVLLTVFMGGATQPGMVGRTEAELISRAVDALRHPLGITGEPVFKRITRYERAIPQYNLGHQGRVDLLQETEQKNPGIFLRGNYRGGISVGDVIRRASS